MCRGSSISVFIVCTPAFVFLVLFSSLPCLEEILLRPPERQLGTQDVRNWLALNGWTGEEIQLMILVVTWPHRNGTGAVFPKVEIGSPLGKICICSGHSKLMHSSK